MSCDCPRIPRAPVAQGQLDPDRCQAHGRSGSSPVAPAGPGLRSQDLQRVGQGRGRVCLSDRGHLVAGSGPQGVSAG